jgi:hypothetical protein
LTLAGELRLAGITGSTHLRMHHETSFLAQANVATLKLTLRQTPLKVTLSLCPP